MKLGSVPVLHLLTLIAQVQKPDRSIWQFGKDRARRHIGNNVFIISVTPSRLDSFEMHNRPKKMDIFTLNL